MHRFYSSFLLGALLLSIPSLSAKVHEGVGGPSVDSALNRELTSFFTEAEASPERLSELEDSLRELETLSQKEQLALEYLEKPLPPRKRIVRMIDSTLGGNEVDRDSTFGIRILIARHSASQGSPFTIPYGRKPFPASTLLPEWNTKRIAPYDRRMEKRSRLLRLVAPEWECGFQLPVNGELTSSFGLRGGRQHLGVDLDLRTGDPVRSAFPGMVRVSRYFDGYGRVVIIRHPNGLETLYAHLHRSRVSPGDEVEAGESIGEGGSTGRSTGSHLHFEIRYRGVPLNPSHFISFSEGRLMGDTLILKQDEERIASYPKGTEFHEVERGDYLYRIAQRYGVSIPELCELNGISRNSTLWVGQRLRVSH